MVRLLRRLLIGKPLHNQEMAQEKMPKWKALSIFSSDALSSVAYGPEQAILALVALPGLITYGYMIPVTLAILLVLITVAISYAQVAKANPGGGGSYAIARQNLGEMPALVAAGSVLADYVLTAAVSVSAGTAAIVSAFPALTGNEVILDVLVLFLVLMLVNLRGIRESSSVFVYPTYAFLLGIFVLLAIGCWQAFTQAVPLIPPQSLARQQLDWATLFIALRAFANGCSSMTGIEAIADSVPLFKKPAARNAVATTYLMAGILGTMLVGVSFLMLHFHIMPLQEVTALSQLSEEIFGRTWMYYYVQISTMIVLYLAANTAYNGLPVLLSIIARDGYMPRYLATRGERLTFSNGIILLTMAAVMLTIIYKGQTEDLISLYAIGVFISFTIAQVSMVVHWNRERGPNWLFRAALNGFGALATTIVVVIIGITKFLYGAWIIMLFIPFMIWVFKKIRFHYNNMAEQLHLPLEWLESGEMQFKLGKNHIVVPVASPTRVVFETLKYAKTLSADVIALHIATDEESAQKVICKWERWNPGVKLVTVYSPYRLVIQPLIDYVEALDKQKQPEDYITVLIPEFEPKKWWHRLLHNQTGWIIRTALILKKNVIVATIPYHLHK
ncbi:MAG: APC family permease [Veillonellales bacterium]